MTYNTHDLVSQEFSVECQNLQSANASAWRDQSIQYGNSYLAEGVVLLCGMHFEHMQERHYTHVLSKYSGNNKVNNYDVTDVHCTAPSKIIKLIYV